MDKHGSGKIWQAAAAVVSSRDLDLNLAKGELVAVISEMDTRGDRRRWLVDAGGRNQSVGTRDVLIIIHIFPLETKVGVDSRVPTQFGEVWNLIY